MVIARRTSMLLGYSRSLLYLPLVRNRRSLSLHRLCRRASSRQRESSSLTAVGTRCLEIFLAAPIVVTTSSMRRSRVGGVTNSRVRPLMPT